jgi:phosphocarrier protein
MKWLHARPPSLFVQTAKKFASKITASYNGKTVNAKSILGLLSLGALTGAEITIQAEEKTAMKRSLLSAIWSIPISKSKSKL